MRIRIEKRAEPSQLMQAITPVAAVVLTMIIGAVIFWAIGYDGPRAVREIFFTPLLAPYKWSDVARRAAPLILIALGLCVGNRAKVWNIGAEGQYIVGALSGAGVAYMTQGLQGAWIVPLMLLAGIVGGAAWGGIPALLKTRYRVNEILSSLMLVYVALQLLNYLVTGPWKDPNGHNFPQTAPFTAAQMLPRTLWGTPFPPGLFVAVALAFVFWLVMARSEFGLAIRVVGDAPKAVRYAGFNADQIVWRTLLISGAMAGLAGTFEATSQSGQLNLGFPSGYGFTAIIVSFLGRLHPMGALLAGIVLAVTYVGGQVAQTVVHVPNATAGIFQAMMLFLILASDVLVRRRIRIIWSSQPAEAAAVAGSREVIVDYLIPALITIVNVSTPILLAATGELVVEKSGVLNLGVEGMMLCGAIAGFAITFETGDPWLGSLAGASAGAVASLLFGLLVLSFGSNQVATGLALVIFGAGVSSLIGAGYVGFAIPSFDSVSPDSLANDPVLKLVFGYSPLVYFAFLMVFAVYWFFNKTRAGLILRAVGENDLSARSIGYSVIGVRYAAIAFGGAMAGVAGSYFSMVITPMWAEGMTAGRGWIALALVVFSGWRAGRLLIGAYFFGLFMTLELYAKASGFSFLPSQFWAAMPYLMAVIVLAVMSARESGGAEAPACLGKPYTPDE